MLKNILKQSAYYLVTLGVGKVLSAVLFAILARVLLPEGFGEINFFISISLLVTALSDLGLRQWYQKMMAQREDEGLLARAAGARLALAFLASIILIAINPRWPGVNQLWLILLIVTLFLEAGYTIADAHFLAHKQSLKLGFKLIGRNLLLFLILPLINRSETSTTYFLYGYVSSMFLVLIFYFPWSAMKKFSWRSIFFIDDIWKKSAPYGVMDGLSMLYSKADSLLIENILGAAALGIYGSAYRVLKGFNLIPQALFHNLFPHAAKKGTISLKQTAKMMGLMGIFGAVLGVLIYVFAQPIIILLVGDNFIEAVTTLQIFAIVNFLFFLNAPLNIIIQSSDHLKKYLPWMGGIVAINIILNINFINRWGMNGAAWAMVACQGLLIVVNLFYLKKIYLDN